MSSYLINLYMFVVALIGSCFYYVQAYKIFSTKSARDLSLTAYTMVIFTSINWLIYGLYKLDYPLIISGIASLTGVLLVILGIYMYRKPKNTF